MKQLDIYYLILVEYVWGSDTSGDITNLNLIINVLYSSSFQCKISLITLGIRRLYEKWFLSNATGSFKYRLPINMNLISLMRFDNNMFTEL